MALAAATALAPLLNKHKSHILDAIAKLHPKLKGPRKFINDTLGFRERKVPNPAQRKQGRKPYKQARPGGQLIGGNGGTIASVNAPVAFARTDFVRPGFVIKALDADTILVHAVDFVGIQSTSGTPAAFVNNLYPINPTDATLFTWISPLLDLFSKFKLQGLKAHFVHQVATSESGAVMMTWIPDPESVPTSSAEMLNTNGCVTGAPYEDFSYTASPKQFQKDWQFISDVTDTDEDDRLIEAGVLCVATVSFANASVQAGRLFLESEWVLTGRRAASLAPMLGALKSIMKSKAPFDQRKAVCHKIVENWTNNIEEKRTRKIDTASLDFTLNKLSKCTFMADCGLAAREVPLARLPSAALPSKTSHYA